MSIENIAVIGGGTMGNGIAHVASLAGRNVTLIDISSEVLDRALGVISGNMDRQVRKDLISEDQKVEAIGRITTDTSVEGGVQGVDLVVEAAPEKAELKYEIFKTLTSAAPAGAILASNTSSISITEIAARTDLPEKVIGMHFMYPGPMMKRVEVIRGLATSDETTSAVVDLTHDLG